MGFQTQVQSTPAPAVAGDFASANPRAVALSTPGGLVAGPNGVTVGKFAWIADDGITVNNFASSVRKPDGFVHREQQALITSYLAESGNVIPAGMEVTLHAAGDFFAKITGATACATRNESVYADYATGDIALALQTGASATGSMGFTSTGTAVSGDATSIDLTSVTGVVTVGETVSGTGITAGTTILSQTSGTPGGAGRYKLSAANTASSATVTGFGPNLHITAVASGTLKVGDPVTGTGVPAGAVIASGPSAGGVGDYVLDMSATAYAASTTITGVAGVDTGWKARTLAAVGELTKISTY